MATNRTFPRWFPWWMAFVYGIAGAALVGISTPKPPAGPPPVLLDSTVQQTVEEQAALIQRLLQDKATADLLNHELGLRVDEATDMLRNAENELVKLRTHIAIDTGPVEPPEPEVVALHIREACDEPDSIDPVGRVRFDLLQFEGENKDDQYRFGWYGYVKCDMRLSEGLEWVELVRAPLTLENFSAASTEPPVAPQRPKRHSLSIDWAVYRSGQSIYDYAQDATILWQPDRFRVRYARRFFPLKRFTPELGVAVDSSTVALTVGLDF